MMLFNFLFLKIELFYLTILCILYRKKNVKLTHHVIFFHSICSGMSGTSTLTHANIV
jgi:hypothetical protein